MYNIFVTDSYYRGGCMDIKKIQKAHFGEAP
jgi:hypothetical protein